MLLSSGFLVQAKPSDLILPKTAGKSNSRFEITTGKVVLKSVQKGSEMGVQS